MLYHILAVGDVVMEPGLRHLERHLRPCLLYTSDAADE